MELTTLKRLRVLIADDHPQCRWAVARLLGLRFDIVAAVANGRQLVETVLSLQPDVIISDISMPLLAGNQALAELKSKRIAIPFVLISSDTSGADEYVREGAMAFVAKMDMGRELMSAVASAYSGEVYVSRSAKPENDRVERAIPLRS